MDGVTVRCTLHGIGKAQVPRRKTHVAGNETELKPLKYKL